MIVGPLFVLLAALLVFCAYTVRLYTESGKLLSREFQENIDLFEHRIEPRLGFSRPRAVLSFVLLEQLFTGAICFLLATSVFVRPSWTMEDAVGAALLAVLSILFFDRFVPYLLFSRTRGGWLLHCVWLLRVAICLAFPLTLILGFLRSVVSLSTAENRNGEPAHPSEAVDALIEAGQDEGILEESDRELIHSVVEFGDKTVRELMTPRPAIVAVSEQTTVEQLTQLLSQHPYSRLPVYRDDLDHVVGIVYAHDLLQVADSDAARTQAGRLMKPGVYFVPESKSASDLLNELQRDNRRMAIVVDEYGGVAGLVTVEDLVEEIVGDLREEGERSELVREDEHRYLVLGSLDASRLEELFDVHLSEDHHATTVGGLVTELAGHIPQPGESVVDGKLCYEVLESTARRVEKLRVSLAPTPADEELES